HGNNEADEPSVTQPLMYRQIKAQETVRTLYGNRLVEEGVLQEGQIDEFMEAYRAGLDEGKNIVRATLGMVGNEHTADWTPFKGDEWDADVHTGVPVETIKRLSDELQKLPAGFELHSRVKRIMADRAKMASGASPLDWGFAETMAYASLLED